MKTKIQLGALITIGLTLGFLAAAQFLPDPVSLQSIPGSPSPGETFTVRALVPAFDKDTAFFDWTVDGKERPDISGTGKDSIKLTAGPVGSSVRVAANVSRPGGLGGSASLTVRVSDLSLTWFAETIVPKWYKGKALPVQNSIVDIAAVPQFVLAGENLAPESLIYRWGLDDQEKALVGVGKQVFRIRISDLPKTSHQIRVAVEDQDKQIRKEGEIFITAAEPEVLIYRVSPLGGIEPRSAAPLFFLGRGLFDFLAEPFFFSVASAKDLLWRWTVNREEVKTSSENPRLLTVDTSKREEDVVLISVTADDKNAAVAPAVKSLPIILK